jgi:hypothetical protein
MHTITVCNPVHRIFYFFITQPPKLVPSAEFILNVVELTQGKL